uniref:Probably inactive leucine-rich repeat receptor-like protein kinase IMK2 n=1 Tax=Tanacetum cinerariifolium TaxID=118510 RepID=A0A6L2KDY0_TANCI|nr:probably inactive leucine-rich repeat receptor-like protein kinase IMK2 [Tanacetum cinerariifolium]
MMLLARSFTQQYPTHTNNILKTSSNTRNQEYVKGGRMDVQGKSIGYAGNTRRNVVSSRNAPRSVRYVAPNTIRVVGNSGSTSRVVKNGKSDNDEVIAVTLGDYSTLQAIKHDLVDLRGVLRTWKGRDGVCSGGWVGIKCDQGRVSAIQLPWKGLGGKISSKFGNLYSLKRISLHDNLLSGVIPQSLWLLPNLRGLYLFNNRLSGSIPPSITPSLQNLDLSNNQLSGTIPNIVSNSTKIYRFNLSYNAFSGSIPPSITLLPSLTFLALEHNNLSGPIPDTWKFGQLTSLTLDHNFLSGKIPTSLSKMSNLEKVNLGHNHINGIIPNEFANLSKLQLLDLSNNVISGSFPSIRTSNLSVLVLDNNQLNGQIFDIVGNLSSLTQLGLSHNYFSGEIPESIGHLKNLDSLNVSYNSLSGSVPSSLLKKFNSTSFVGNIQLCGYSISTPCPTPSISPSPSSSQVHPSNQKQGKNRKLSTKDIILIAAGALLLVLLLLCCLLLCCLIRKKSAARSKSKKTKTDVAMAVPPVAGAEVVESGETGGKLVHFSGPFVFTADDLLCATAEIMGKSTYGTSYKATLEDGNMVAVKRLREKVTKAHKEFETEAAELGKIRHENILTLRAYYLGPKGEKLLVFDYMPHGSLASFLHARGPESVINWSTRLNIIVDEQKNPAIADVGLSRLMTNAANTNVVATAGTLGYRAPELSKLKNANTKTDIYSLGVIILELLTGKSPSEATDGLDLPQWVASIFKNEWTNEIFDLELMGDPANVGGDELLNTLRLAMHCVDPSPEERPEAVQVLEKLEEIKPELVQSSDDAAVAAATAGVPSKSD